MHMMNALKRPLRSFTYAAALTGSLMALPAWASDLKVEINHSRLHTLGQAASTIIVGNPAIADVSLSNNNTLVVFGRSYGSTNLLVLNAAGSQIASLDVKVTGARDSVVTLNRGNSQLSYACAPNCVRVVNPADATEPTDTLLATTKGVTSYGDASAGASSDQE